MFAIWDRLEQLGLSATTLNGSGPLIAVLAHPHLEEHLRDVVPESFSAAAADWLSWQRRTELLLRADGAAPGTGLRMPVADGFDLVGSTLSAGSLSLGVLVARVPSGTPPPWPASAARRLAHILAAEMAPHLARAVEREQSFRQGIELLQLHLQRQGPNCDNIALLGNEQPLEYEGAFHGAVQVDGVGMSYLGRVRGGPSPAGFVPVVMTLFGRWLADLPDPDPSTVIDAVHSDLLALLEPLHAEIEATVVVPGPGLVKVSTTDTLVVIVAGDGTILDRALPDEVTVSGKRLGIRRTEELPAPPGSSVVAIGGLTDTRTLLDLIAAAGGAPCCPLSFASQLRSRVEQRTTLTGGVLVHALAGAPDGLPPQPLN